MAPSRRDFLKGTLGATTAAAGLPAHSGARVKPAVNLGPISLDALPPAPALTPIEHVVVVMMENRSFDHFMGWLPGADGIGLTPDGTVVDAERFSSFSYTDRLGARHGIYHEEQWNACGLGDQDHGYTGGRTQWNHGKMDGFVQDPENTEFSLSYYLAAQRVFTSPLAMHYTTCDRYFCSYLGPTWPNRFFQHAAQTDRQNDTLAPDSTKLPVYPATMPTIWDQLNHLGGPTGRYYFSDVPFLALWGATHLAVSAPVPEFFVDAAAGTLPNFSVVDPRFEGEGSGTSGDDHPLADIRAGDAFLSELFHAVANGPLWSKTMFIINYDEWGGFFDHVAPPVVAPGNQILDLSDVQRNAAGVITGVLAGFRVPCIIASPYSKGSPDAPRISSLAYDHTSILRFVEMNWKLHPLTPRDASIPLLGPSTRQLSNIGYALDFSSPDNTVPELPLLAPFVSTGCDIPGFPEGGPVVGGQSLPEPLPTPHLDRQSSRPTTPRPTTPRPATSRPPTAWSSLRSSDLMKGWA